MLLDTNWRFYLGDLENAYEKNYSDADWRQVTIPHDWSIEHPKDRSCSSGTGYVIGGTAWYFSVLTECTKTVRSGSMDIILADVQTDIFHSAMISQILQRSEIPKM